MKDYVRKASGVGGEGSYQQNKALRLSEEFKWPDHHDSGNEILQQTSINHNSNMKTMKLVGCEQIFARIRIYSHLTGRDEIYEKN